MPPTSLTTRYGPAALITGAAQGIGEALARVLAERGLRLVLVDRQEERLHAVAASLATRPTVVVEDLADPGAIDRIVRNIHGTVADGLELGLVAHVAAAAPFGELLDVEPAALAASVDVNCRAPLLLTRALAPAMCRRGRGGVLLFSSLAAWQGAPRLAAYTASRAYTLNLAQSLWTELRPHGVDVLGVCPGATHTPGFDSLAPDPKALRLVPTTTAEAVAREALARLPHGPVWVVGRRNRAVQAVLTRLLPRRLANQVIADHLDRLYGRRLRAR